MNTIQVHRVCAALCWLLLCLAWCCRPALADAPTATPTPERLVIHLGQEMVDFHPVRIDGQQYVPTDDSGLTRLLEVMGTTFDWSADHNTLDINLPGRAVHWDVLQNRGTVAGQPLELPGALQSQNGTLYVQVAALTRLLGLTLSPIDAAVGSYGLLTSIQSVTVDVDGNLVFCSSGPIAGQVRADGSGCVVEFPNTGWALPTDDVTVGSMRIHMQRRGDGQTSTLVQVALPAGTRGQLGTSASPSQCLVRLAATETPVAYSSSGPARITNMAVETSSSDRLVYRIDGAGPYTANYDADSGTLQVNILHSTVVGDLVASQPLDSPFASHLDTVLVGSDLYPQVRLTFKLNPDCGYRIERMDGLRIILSRTEAAHSDPIPPGSGGLIVIDPGHGGSDPGCHSPWTGLEEKTVTLDISLRLKQLLEARGVRVMLTRSDDRDLTYAGSPNCDELGARAAVANRHHAVLFVSVHCNASVSHALNGATIHWFKPKDYRLASMLRSGLRLGDLGVPLHGLVHSNFYVLRHTVVPSVLVETAFLTNHRESILLSSPDFREHLAEVLANSLAAYVGRVGSRSVHSLPRVAGYNHQ